jgi:hypothetical protein
MQTNEAEGIAEQAEGAEARDRIREGMLDSRTRLKILLHFMKGRIFLTPMETIIMVLGELEYLEGLVKLAKIKKDEKIRKNQVTIINNTHVVKRISMNKTY